MQGEGSVSLDKNGDSTLSLPNVISLITNAGKISIKGGVIDASGDGGGRVAIWGGDTSVKNSIAFADSNGIKDANSAKGIDIHTDSLHLDNSIVSSDVADGTGKAGKLSIKTKNDLEITNGAIVSSSTWSQGNAGGVSITANNLKIDGENSSNSTGIFSNTEGNGKTEATVVNVGSLEILNGGEISNSTWAEGNTGEISVTANTLKIDAGNFTEWGTGIFSNTYETGRQAGDIIIKVGNANILNAGAISNSTYGQSDAGEITVEADSLRIDGQSSVTGIFSRTNENATGNSGSLAIQARNLELFNGGEISSSTFSKGDAGNVSIIANMLNIDNQSSPMDTGVFSQARANTGNAGSVDVKGENVNVTNSGKISSATNTQGNAGAVVVTSKILNVIDKGLISSASLETGSSGKTGDVIITVTDKLHIADGGKITIQNEANSISAAVIPIESSAIVVNSPNIEMKNGGSITSDSSGNIAAGNITVNFSNRLNMENSSVNTTANTGDGGFITINGGEVIYLKNSGFETTVHAEKGNGGDISAKASVLVMDTGLIQANAVSGSGGNINLALDALIPNADTLTKGGKPVDWKSSFSTMNVIQAASQAGINGQINITSPQLNLSGVLANMGGLNYNNSVIDQDYCSIGQGSSLTRKGKGGLPRRGKDLQVY